jgi:hypothetical protein
MVAFLFFSFCKNPLGTTMRTKLQNKNPMGVFLRKIEPLAASTFTYPISMHLVLYHAMYSSEFVAQSPPVV